MWTYLVASTKPQPSAPQPSPFLCSPRSSVSPLAPVRTPAPAQANPRPCSLARLFEALGRSRVCGLFRWRQMPSASMTAPAPATAALEMFAAAAVTSALRFRLLPKTGILEILGAPSGLNPGRLSPRYRLFRTHAPAQANPRRCSSARLFEALGMSLVCGIFLRSPRRGP